MVNRTRYTHFHRSNILILVKLKCYLGLVYLYSISLLVLDKHSKKLKQDENKSMDILIIYVCM